MSTPWKLLTRKSDPWIVKAKKKLARYLWNDLTRSQDLPEPAEGYPGADPPPKRLLASFDVRKHFSKELERVRREDE